MSDQDEIKSMKSELRNSGAGSSSDKSSSAGGQPGFSTNVPGEVARAMANQSSSSKKHKVSPDETLGAIANKYYGHATEPYWRLIYEHNQGLIGNDPGKLRPGIELVIPDLPDNLKG